MNNKIIAIGLRTNQSANVFSGQSMMFEAFVDFLKANGYNLHIINLSSKYTNIHVGSISIRRVFEYILIILGSLTVFIKNRGSVVYITTAQTKGGFLRDFVFINLAGIFGCKILIQQFGANFSNFYNSVSPFFKFFVRNTFNKGQYIVVEGEYTKMQFKILKYYQRKVITITNGLPEKSLKTNEKGKKYNQNTSFNLIYLSYMIESKGYWDVLHAVNILVNEMNQNVKCVFSGAFKPSIDDTLFNDEKEAKISFQKYIHEKGLQERIVYYEGLMGEKKADAFLHSHAFLMPTYFKFEGQPVSVLEAMAYGAVPIVTKYRMIPEMVTTETGLFVDKKSPKQIAKAVMFLIENPNVYANLSQASINRYLELFTLEKYCYNLLDVIKQI